MQYEQETEKFPDISSFCRQERQHFEPVDWICISYHYHHHLLCQKQHMDTERNYTHSEAKKGKALNTNEMHPRYSIQTKENNVDTESTVNKHKLYTTQNDP